MSNPQVDADGWTIGEKRQHCANCGKERGKTCNRKKRVGIGFCRDWVDATLKGGN